MDYISHIKSIGSLNYLYDVLKDCKTFSFDTETTIGEELKQREDESDKQYKKRRIQLLNSDIRIHPKKVQMFCIAFYAKGKKFYLEVGDFKKDKLIEGLADIFKLKAIKIAHRATFDINVLENFGVHVESPVWCSKVMACVHNENDVEIKIVSGKEVVTYRYELEFLAKKYLGIEAKHVDMEKFDITEVSLEDRMKYNAEDAEWCYKLAKIFYKGIKEQKLLPVLKLEMDTVLLFAEIEREGVRINKEYLQRNFDKLNELKEKIENKAYKIIGKEINLGSSKQLGALLFEEYNLPVIKKTKTGYSTDKHTLKKLKDKHPLIPLLLKRKKIDKIVNTYITAYIDKELEGRLYFELRAYGTRTGRTSSANPNLAQLPTGKEETEKWSRIPKKAIYPDKDHVFISADYSQIEYRVLAHYSKDRKILRAYEENPKADFHSIVANDLKITRQEGKKVNFATVYGQSARSLGELLGIDKDDAEKFQRKYFSRYPGIKTLQESTWRKLKRDGYVRDYFGRKRRLPDINSTSPKKVDHAKRQAFNFIIQGTASADLTKIVMHRLDKYYKKHYPGRARIVLTVYDEILTSCHKDIAEELAPKIKYIMENTVKFNVPIIVDVKIKKRWFE